GSAASAKPEAIAPRGTSSAATPFVRGASCPWILTLAPSGALTSIRAWGVSLMSSSREVSTRNATGTASGILSGSRPLVVRRTSTSFCPTASLLPALRRACPSLRGSVVPPMRTVDPGGHSLHSRTRKSPPSAVVSKRLTRIAKLGRVIQASPAPIAAAPTTPSANQRAFERVLGEAVTSREAGSREAGWGGESSGGGADSGERKGEPAMPGVVEKLRAEGGRGSPL